MGVAGVVGGGRPAELGHVAGSESRLLARVEGLTDAEAAAPSRLPGWSRAEVLTHVARNADSFRAMAEAAMRDEVADQYPGGIEQRSADIAAGRGRSAVAVVADLSQAVEWLHETWAAMPDDAWSRPGRSWGSLMPMAETVRARWIEVEVHHVDLALGASAEDWSLPFCQAALTRLTARLPLRAQEPPDARWVLWADDLALAWSVSALAGQVTVSRFEEDDPPPDVIVRGPGAQLTAWLLDRESRDLAVSGDGRLYRQFHQAFPGP
ncbi:MAG: maleylpyruvate isomerase [Acidimicrobiaceae bacterium]|nr:maleylpyruvate isomerase [Acidimicrobiaceae bacterium]